MGKVAVTYRIMPTGVEDNLGKLAEEVKGIIGAANLAKLKERPVAFGLKYLEVVCIMDDATSNSAEIEARLGELKGAQSVEITDVYLL
ncbi:MAG: elongation factor 1-beta [Thermoplasmata archaeon]|nr:elongation factor 1-beta [Thermoplasmata archaeon]